MPRAELTVIANVALDRVNRGRWTCGGCPTFASYAFEHLDARGVIHTACAEEDRAAFEDLPGEIEFTRAAATTRFDLDYSGEFGETRRMVLRTIGHEWSEADIDRLDIDSDWVHLAPLLRSDFPVATVARLAARGHRVAFDGQGLVRVPQLGELSLDARYDPELLGHLSALKLSEDELGVLAADQGREHALEGLSGIPELLLTFGYRGAEVRAGGDVSHVSPGRLVAGVQTTGAGDVFMIAHLIGRHRGLEPAAAAAEAAELTAAMLAERKASSS